jgi:hypothetical protein
MTHIEKSKVIKAQRLLDEAHLTMHALQSA